MTNSYLKAVLNFLLLLLNLHISAIDDGCISKLKSASQITKSNFQILFLKGGDCINCYKAGEIALKNKTINPDAIFIKDVAKRDIEDFLANQMDIHIPQYPIIKNDSLWDCLNRYGTSAIGYFENNTLQRIVQTKSLFATREVVAIPASSIQVMPVVDTFDITPLYGGIKSSVGMIGDDFLIYNDTKGLISIYSPVQRKQIKKIVPSQLDYLKLDSLKGLFPDKSSKAIDRTLEKISQKSPMLSRQVSISQPYTFGNTIMIPMSISIIDTIIFEGLKREVLIPSSLLGIYSTELEKKKLIGFPWLTYDNNDSICNSLTNGTLMDSCHFNMMMGVYGRPDSIFATLDVCSLDPIHPKTFLNVKYPPDFPLKSKQGIYHSYVTKFISIKGMEYYYFGVDNHLYQIKDDSKVIKLKGIADNNRESQISNAFIYDIAVHNDTLCVLYSSDKFTSLKLDKYRVKDFEHISTSTVTFGKLAGGFFHRDMICTIYSDDERVTIYRYKL